jgi:hypothetical protein
MNVNSTQEAIPKLKIMGLIVFSGMFMQLASLSTTWFTFLDNNFSIKGVSSLYEIDMMGLNCSTFENSTGFQCYCGNYCKNLSEIYDNGLACMILIIVSANFCIAEIISIRRKIWRCEGVILPRTLIDNDGFIVLGGAVLSITIIFWLWRIFLLQNSVKEVSVSIGINVIIVSCALHMISNFYYFIKIKPETRPR